MILAAGRGERLRPITDHTPKPLIRVGTHRLIEHHIIALSTQLFDRVVINVSHLGDQVVQKLGNGARYGIEIVYSKEEHPLETGGGICQALPLLRSETFLVINGDIFTDFQFEKRILETRDNIHLIMVENPLHNPKGDFALHRNRVTAHASANVGNFTFSGIGYYRRSVFSSMTAGKFPLAPIIRSEMESDAVSGKQHIGVWVDVGTKERLKQANEIAMNTA
ncbi:MAG: NTP transferase domain-containing protein [Gammaproteobacteria bacterium]|nr:NTP transferase domain-containing protein [Gammaproteobacteria bacterium]NKB65361.1 NTP transferase domain-containing protein [Gammaproteobacteria bacterium]